MLVQAIVQVAQVDDVAVIPDARRHAVGVIGFRRDRTVFGAARTPSTFGLHTAIGRLRTRLLGAGADAMRNLVEAVLHRLRADLDRLEQNVVFWIARHGLTSRSFLLLHQLTPINTTSSPYAAV